MTAQGRHAAQFVVEVTGIGASAEAASEAKIPPSFVQLERDGDDRYTNPASLQAANGGHGYAVSLQRPDAIKAGETVSFIYRFAENGVPVNDLRPYLDAPLHLAVVKDDLTAFLHEHGTLPGANHPGHGDHGSSSQGHADGYLGPATFGPEIVASFSFPEPGTYHLFAQAIHGDHLLISRFPVQVQ